METQAKFRSDPPSTPLLLHPVDRTSTTSSNDPQCVAGSMLSVRRSCDSFDPSIFASDDGWTFFFFFLLFIFFVHIHYCRIYLSIKSLRHATRFLRMLSWSSASFTRSNAVTPFVFDSAFLLFFPHFFHANRIRRCIISDDNVSLDRSYHCCISYR